MRSPLTASFYSQYFKRALDLVAVVILSVPLAPIMVGLCLVLRLAHGSPVLFQQRRPGLHGRVFTMVKLRTMTDARDTDGNLLPDDQRLTRFGRLIRRLSLDEVPQLWNVFKGEMSLIGPRPLLCEYLPHYSSEQNRRHEVRPGITGWAQVNGRQDIPFSRRLELDVWYVKNVSLKLDALIFWRSCVTALAGDGVRSGQDVRTVDDLGLHDETRSLTRPGAGQLAAAQSRASDTRVIAKEPTDGTDTRIDRAA